MMNGILWVLRTGAPWRDLPEWYGPWSSVFIPFRRWKEAGVWDRVLVELQAQGDLQGELDWEGRKLFIRNSKEGKDRIVYMSDTAEMSLRRQLESRSDQKSPHLFPTRNGFLSPRGLQKRLVKRGRECSVSVTAQRLRHTFASQMLATGMPVTSLQRYLGHEDLDTTMLYSEEADPLLQKDYYQGISAFDPATSRLAQPGTPQAFRKKMEQLVNELKTSDLAPKRKQEILEQMQLLLDQGLLSKLDDNH